MKRTITSLFLAASALTSVSAHAFGWNSAPGVTIERIDTSAPAPAPTIALEPSEKPLDPAILQVGQSAPSRFEVRTLDLDDAKKLLDSTEGPAWRVLQVQAPACEDPKTKNKDARKVCKALKADCKEADKFAHEYSKHAACSALYTQTQVLLTNDGSGQKVKRKVADKKVVHKHSASKAKPHISKKKAHSC